MLALSFSLSIEKLVWIIAAVIVICGALGVVSLRNPVHNALSLVATLFGVAVLFIIEQAYFLAAIQVIVYAGAIVVLFLFVIMLLGVDRADDLLPERTWWRQPAAYALAGGLGILAAVAALVGTATVTGDQSVSGRLDPENDIRLLGKSLFTDHVYAFEITAVLLTIAVVGAVMLSRRPHGDPIDLDEFDDPFAGDDLDPADDAEVES